jgi:hypothetical protein
VISHDQAVSLNELLQQVEREHPNTPLSRVSATLRTVLLTVAEKPSHWPDGVRKVKPRPRRRRGCTVNEGHTWTSGDCRFVDGVWEWPCDCGVFGRDWPSEEVFADMRGRT